MPERLEPYKWQTRLRSILSIAMGGITAVVPVRAAWALYRNLSIAAMLVMYIASAVLLSFAWRLYFDRPEELGKRIPISSKERRRMKKEFYDWLASLGRR